MLPLFYRDTLNNIEVSYSQLFSDLEKERTYNPYCKSSSYYDIFKQIILSLIIGKEIILLDDDFSDDEIERLLDQDYQFVNSSIPIDIAGKITIKKIETLIQLHENNWRITLFTSGTTGLPKKVTHTLESISRFLKKGEDRKHNVWGYAYNPTHMAGLQVFFQAFMNNNPIIRLFGLEKNEIFDLISKYNITNISATPTFFRMLLPSSQVCKSITRITSGGEKIDHNILNQLKILFPNSQFRNVYATTETGTIFASDGDIFTVNHQLTNLIKIEDQELHIHSSLMGASSSLKLIDGWYATGDLVELLSENPFRFKFVSRINDMINTGGYKVNPTEVEDVLRLYEGVKDVIVFGKSNSVIGNVVCCEVIKTNPTLTEKELRIYAQRYIQEFKIPRIIRFVDKLTITRTGKISRKKN